MSQTVLITPSHEHVDSTKYDHVISVEEVFAGISQDDILETTNRVSSLDVPNTGCIEFSILWQRMTNSQTSNLTRAILFSQHLERHLDDLGVTHGTLICEASLEEPYVRVVDDLAKMTSMKTKRQGRKQSWATLFVLIQMISIIIKTGFIIGDWFIARLRAVGADLTDKTVVYIPPIKRLNSTLPVVELFDTKPRTIITEPSWYYALQFNTKPDLAAYNPVCIHQYLSISGFFGQIRDLATISREVLTAHSFAPALADAVRNEFSSELDSTTKALVRDNLSNLHLVRALLLQRSLQAVFAADNTEKVVMGTLDPLGRAIVHEATEHDLKVYHIPHSVATTQPPNPGSEVVQFVSGEWDIEYYKQVVPRDQWWQWVPSGRPYLSELAEQYGDKKERQPIDKTEHDRLKVLLATQPFSQNIRKQFINTMLSLFESDRFEVIIKPHPDEDVEIYNIIESKCENSRVITSGLYEQIVDSDLTVTVSSNVGLESIVIGTPTVCFNAWEPYLLIQTFAFADEVPVFNSKSEFQTFVNQLDIDKIDRLCSQQQAFVERSYRIEPDIAATIATYIESDLDDR